MVILKILSIISLKQKTDLYFYRKKTIQLKIKAFLVPQKVIKDTKLKHSHHILKSIASLRI